MCRASGPRTTRVTSPSCVEIRRADNGGPKGRALTAFSRSKGLVPSVIEERSHSVSARRELASGRIGYYSPSNNVTVVVEDGRVVTVASGRLKIR